MNFFTRFVAFLGLIFITALIICCFSCADFMRDEDKYFDFKWNNCKYMTKHKFPYTDKSYEEYEDNYRCYCRYFQFMSPNTLAPVMVTLVLFLLWLNSLNFLIKKENAITRNTLRTLRTLRTRRLSF